MIRSALIGVRETAVESGVALSQRWGRELAERKTLKSHKVIPPKTKSIRGTTGRVIQLGNDGSIQGTGQEIEGRLRSTFSKTGCPNNHGEKTKGNMAMVPAGGGGKKVRPKN